MDSDYASTIKPFLKKIVARQASESQLRRAVARTHAIDFNPFSVVRLNEIRLSSIIAFLLKPYASHGQGTLFLDEFLKLQETETESGSSEDVSTVSISNVKLVTSEAKVFTEYIVPSGRIDILVMIPRVERTGKPDFRLIIENKFGAAETGNQLAVYDKWARGESGTPGEDYRLLYLTPRTESPKNPIPGLVCLSYEKHILETWLPCARSGIAATRVWQYVSDLEDYFWRRLSGGMARMEHEKLTQEIVSDPEAVQAAIDVANIQSSLKKHLAEQLRDKLNEEMQRNQVQVTADEDRPNFGDQYSGYRFRIGYDDRLQFFFRFKQKDFQELRCGLKWRGLKEELASDQRGFSEVRRKIAGKLDLELKENPENETFALYAKLPTGVPKDWDNGEVWARVQNGEIQAAMSDFVRNTVIPDLKQAKLL